MRVLSVKVPAVVALLTAASGCSSQVPTKVTVTIDHFRSTARVDVLIQADGLAWVSPVAASGLDERDVYEFDAEVEYRLWVACEREPGVRRMTRVDATPMDRDSFTFQCTTEVRAPGGLAIAGMMATPGLVSAGGMSFGIDAIAWRYDFIVPTTPVDVVAVTIPGWSGGLRRLVVYRDIPIVDGSTIPLIDVETGRDLEPVVLGLTEDLGTSLLTTQAWLTTSRGTDAQLSNEPGDVAYLPPLDAIRREDQLRVRLRVDGTSDVRTEDFDPRQMSTAAVDLLPVLPTTALPMVGAQAAEVPQETGGDGGTVEVALDDAGYQLRIVSYAGYRDGRTNPTLDLSPMPDVPYPRVLGLQRRALTLGQIDGDRQRSTTVFSGPQ